jgi:hypothetical protein
MCTGTANSRHNPPTIQRYIPNNVQRNDSSSSDDGVIGGSLDLIFCFRATPSFFLMSEMKTENRLLGKVEVARRGALVASSQAS